MISTSCSLRQNLQEPAWKRSVLPISLACLEVKQEATRKLSCEHSSNYLGCIKNTVLFLKKNDKRSFYHTIALGRICPWGAVCFYAKNFWARSHLHHVAPFFSTWLTFLISLLLGFSKLSLYLSMMLMAVYVGYSTVRGTSTFFAFW